jgi:hypothetical protein
VSLYSYVLVQVVCVDAPPHMILLLLLHFPCLCHFAVESVDLLLSFIPTCPMAYSIESGCRHSCCCMRPGVVVSLIGFANKRRRQTDSVY